MGKALAILDRQLGDRCCDVNARPSRSHNDATAIAADLEHLAHPVRLQLLDVLARNEGRVCVCDLEPLLGVKQPTVSHHLKQLVDAGLLEREKRGTYAFYRLRPGMLDRIGGLLTDRAVATA